MFDITSIVNIAAAGQSASTGVRFALSAGCDAASQRMKREQAMNITPPTMATMNTAVA